MAVNFKKKIAGKKTKLAGKSLEGIDSDIESSPILDQYVEGNLYKTPLSVISPDPNQPRKYFNKEKLAELAESIKNKGVLQPILIRKNDINDINKEFLIVAGERRFRASQLAELEVIPTIYTAGDPEEIALIENLQRDDLKPVEEADAYARIMESHGYTQKKLSSVVGKARSTITETLTLNNLPEELKTECRTSNISKSVLLEIAKCKNSDEMISLYNKVKNENFTVAKIRQLTRPKPERKKCLVEERALLKIIETKKLIIKINRVDLNKENKSKLWEEFNDLHRIMNNILSQ